MNIFIRALTPAKREAQSRVVDVFWTLKECRRRCGGVQPENQRIAFSCQSANLLILWWT